MIWYVVFLLMLAKCISDIGDGHFRHYGRQLSARSSCPPSCGVLWAHNLRSLNAQGKVTLNVSYYYYKSSANLRLVYLILGQSAALTLELHSRQLQRLLL